MARKDLPFVREAVPQEEARSRIAALDPPEPYKMEILEGILAKDPDAEVTIYHIGDPGSKGSWWDLCAGPHVERTGEIDVDASLSLESVAGAYWRGDETRPMLQRVYGTVWETPEQLAYYLHVKEEAKRRDHRVLGRALDLFSLQEDAGGGLAFWHPKGAAVRGVMEDFWRDVHRERGYDLLYTPHVGRSKLWETSGHADFYADGMFGPMEVEGESYRLRPMNCPFHVQVYKDRPRSYRDLPVRYAELGTVYRYERSGTMHGLFRVRGFTQDDGHIFCTEEDVQKEIRDVLDLIETLLATFGFDASLFEINLSTRPEKSVGSDKVWKVSEDALRGALEQKGWSWTVDEGGGAFYGPKIDVKVLDAIGRRWQCSTVQLDFNLPERFGLEYVTPENERRQPIMIHRAIWGSVERFFGILVENYAGAFPPWLAPQTVRVLPVSAAEDKAAATLVDHLKAHGVRAGLDGGERLGKLMRAAETDRVPIVLVVGARDLEGTKDHPTCAMRTYVGGELGTVSQSFAVDQVVAAVKAKAMGVDADAVRAEAARAAA